MESFDLVIQLFLQIKKQIMRTLLSLFIALSFTLTSYAQFNFTAGYSYGRMPSGVNNEIIQKINDNNSSLINYEKMREIKGLHGFHFGAQMRFDFVALFASWNNKVQVSDFKGDDSSNESIERELFYRVNSTSVGLELFPIEKISFGGSIDINRFRIRSEDNVASDRYTIMKDKGLSSHFFVSLNISGSDLLSISLQPYIHIPWTKFNLFELESELDTGVGLTDFEDGFMNYGVRLIFRNGQQNF